MKQCSDERSAAVCLDVMVIGAGQAGLASGYFLRRTGLRFRLFDRARRIDDSWRRRYDSLVLFNRDDSSWLHIPEAVDDAGNYVEDQGVSPVRGLFHVGRSWQTSRASALLCGVGDDTAQAVNRVVTSLQNPVALPQSRTLDVRLPERNQEPVVRLRHVCSDAPSSGNVSMWGSRGEWRV